MTPEICDRCDEPLPERARYCPSCGSPILAPAHERRLVTVVFADLVGSTELSSGLDPERFREVIGAFYDVVTDEITSLGGRAEQYVGDAVMGVFGVPSTHDDDAVRGIRAGLSIVERASLLGESLSLPAPLAVRVGVNTGHVAVGSGSGPNLVSGAEVNLAARLQQAAEPGEVLVGRTTHQLAEARVEFGAGREVRAKGFAEVVPAWPALRLGPRSTRASIPLVDRRRELALLSGAFERAVDRGRAHLVTLLGEPGIGKTRVVEGFLEGLPEGARVLAGRPATLEEEIALGPVAEMLLREMRVEPDAPPEILGSKLGELVRGWVEPEEAERTARRLGLALGLGGDGSDENRYLGAEVRAGLTALLTGIATRGPVVLVCEDLHIADPVMLDLIEQLVREARRLPLLVVCTARWGFLDERPGWAAGLADAVTLWVEPLAADEAVQLAVEAGGLDRREAMRVAEHAGGNPLFIVEITGMLLRDDRAVPERGSAPPRLLPPTVQAVVASRMDHLSPDARELVRRASIFARGVFDVSELELVADPRMDLLEELEDEELLVRDPERPTVWRFRADVLRDVAYDSLAKRERQRLHLRVATKLSEPETADRHPRAIAYHLEQAALAALDLEPGDRTLADRAVEALSHAGDVARGRVESRAAAESYEHALALAGAESGWGEREAWILKGLGEARYWLGEYEAAERAFERALEVAGEASVRVRVHASRFLADLALTFRGDLDRAAELFGHATLAARELDSDRVLARTLLMAAWVPYWRGELERARAMFEEALAISSEDPWAGSRALVGLASVVSPAGDEEEALGLALRALAVGEESGHAFTTAVAHEKTALCLRRLLRLDEALEHSDRAVATYRELGARWELASALDDRGVIHRLAGRLDEAERDLRESLRLSLELEERALGPWSAADLARVLVMKGDPVEARSLLDEHGSRSTPGESGPVPAVLAADAHVAYATGDAETARERSIAAVEAERRSGPAPNHLATLVWWTARLFGDDAVGGEAVAREARDRLERNHWRQALVEPELVLEAAPAGR